MYTYMNMDTGMDVSSVGECTTNQCISVHSSESRASIQAGATSLNKPSRKQPSTHSSLPAKKRPILLDIAYLSQILDADQVRGGAGSNPILLRDNVLIFEDV